MVDYKREVELESIKKGNKHLMEKELMEKKVGPGYYESKDDMVKERVKNVIFGKEELEEEKR